MTGLIRASDADRESVAERLRRAHAEGRLDTSELEERVERCYAAKTRADLEPLVSDLPEPHERRRARRALPYAPLFLAPLALAILLLGATHHSPLPLVPILFFAFIRFGRRRMHWHR